MQIVGIIPARYESSRFPGKPLADIHGKPMIRHVYERCMRAGILDRLLVATDDRRILDAVRSFGGDAILTADSHPSGTDRIAEACRILHLDSDSIVVNIQGDEPLLRPVMISRLVEALGGPEGASRRQGDSMDSGPDGGPAGGQAGIPGDGPPRGADDCPMATLAFESRDANEYLDPNVVKVVVDRGGRALYFSRAPLPFHRDGAGSPPRFLKHLGFYAYRNDFLQLFTRLPEGELEKAEKLEQLRALENGYSIRVALSPVETHGVDTPGDLERIRAAREDFR